MGWFKWVALAMCGSLAGCVVISKVSTGSGSLASVVGSGKSTVEDRKVGSFTSLEAGGVFDGRYQKGSAEKLSMEAESNLLPHISTKVEGGKLVIETTASIEPHQPIIVRITNPSLSSAEFSGAAKASLMGLDEPQLKLELSGTAQAEATGKIAKLSIDQSGASSLVLSNQTPAAIDVSLSGTSKAELHAEANGLKADASGAAHLLIDRVNGDDVTASVSGTAEMTFAGAVRTFSGQAEGASNLTLDKLTADRADASASGTSHIKVGVKETLKAEASGASSIVYFGSPQVQKDVSGVSSIEKG